MQEIVDDVIKAEGEAETIVQKARETAARLKNDSDTELDEKLKKSKDDAMLIIQNALSQAKADADREYREAMDKANRENEDFFNKNREKIDQLVDKIVKLLITPEYNRE